MSVLKAVHAHLSADASVTTALATFDFGSGAEPAIFTTLPPPPEAGAPLIAITQTGGTLTGRDRTTRGGEITLDVNVWGERLESEKTIIDAAMAVWRSLDRTELSVDDYEAYMTLADPPLASNDPEGFPGYRITTQVFIRELSTTS